MTALGTAVAGPADTTGQSPGYSRDRANGLGREMIELNAHITGAQARFLELLAEFDRDELWRCLGCHSAAQWLTWQCGFGEVAARERVRVARALEKLPKISGAFRSGQISYSKVRELTRGAAAETEDSLLSIALHGTAANVQRLVARSRRIEQLDATATERYRRRYVRYRHNDDGTVMIEANLPVEIGEVVIKAIDAAVEVLYRKEFGTDRVESGRQEAASSDVAGGSGEITEESGEHHSDTECDVPAGTPMYDHIGGNVQVCEAEIEANGRNIESELATNNVVLGVPGPAATVPAETSSDQAQLRLLPASDRGQTSSSSDASDFTSSVSPLRDTPGEAARLSARRADALRLLAINFLSAPLDGAVDTSADRYQVVVHIDHALLTTAGVEGQLHRRLNALRTSAGATTRCELENGQALAVETARRLACDATLVGIVEEGNGGPLSVGRRTRAISPALRRALRARDGSCRFPGCGRTRFTHGHHIIHWANGGETCLSNLITLCTFHHTLVHEGGFSIHRLHDGTFAFFAPDGQRLPECGQPEQRTVEALSRAAEQGRVTLRREDNADPADADPKDANFVLRAAGRSVQNGDSAQGGVRERRTH